ncbi:MAG: ABC transporter substrate-binding protein [Deltaproteobacteria bacterium]|nr:ABC transporter substrate-binding protein [Deltaproteobacteria bacterium]
MIQKKSLKKSSLRRQGSHDIHWIPPPWRTGMTRGKLMYVFITFFGLLFLSNITFGEASKAALGSATRAIQGLDDKLDDYRTGPNLSSEDEEYNRQLKKDILHGTFDIRELSQQSLGSHWKDITDKERDDFVQLMTDLLENRAILSKEQGQKKAKSKNLYSISYKGDKYLNAEKTRVLTRTSVYVKSEDIRVELDYKLKKISDVWKIYDVIVDNASLGENYKFQFDSIIKKNGYAELVRRMQSRLDSLKKKNKS